LVAGRRSLHEIAADLAVLAAGPHHRDVGDSSVADPPLAPVQHVLVAVLDGGGFEQQRIGAVVGFGECEGADLLHPGQGWQPLTFVFRRAEVFDGTHDETSLDPGEGGETAIAPGQFHRDDACRGGAHRRLPLAADAVADQAEFAHPAGQS